MHLRMRILLFCAVVLLASHSLQSPVQSSKKRLRRESSKDVFTAQNEHHDIGALSSLSALVGARPRTQEKASLQEYNSRFSYHPDVQRINLKGASKESDIAQGLLDLRDPGESREWNVKMTASIKQYLRDNNIDQKTIRRVCDYYRNEKCRKASRKYVMKRSKEKGKAYNRKKELARKVYAKQRALKDSQMDKPLGSHLGDSQSSERVSYHDLVARAANFNKYYTSPNTASWALRQYMLTQKYPEKDIRMAIVARAERAKADVIAEEEKRLAFTATHIPDVVEFPARQASVSVRRKRLPEKWYDTKNL